MELKVIRKEFLPDRCLGELFINGKYFCNTLEDTDRGLNKDMSNNEIDDIKIKVFDMVCVIYEALTDCRSFEDFIP